MSGILSKWSVLEERIASPEDLDTRGAVRTDVIDGWIDDACQAYLAQCAVLGEIREQNALALQCDHPEIAPESLSGRPTAVVVSATATEVWPDAFAISVRIRPRDGDSDQAVNVVCEVRLLDAAGAPVELGTAVRDELIALEHAAPHYN
jgi:hypothetical protein